MEAMLLCKEQCESLEKQICEAKSRWQTFLSSQSSYKPCMKLAGERLPPPVMTAEKRKKMQMYRKQAYIAEVRVKSRSREKEFMDKIQGALDEIREFHVNTSSSEEEDMSERTQLKLDLSSFTNSSSQLGNDSSSLLNTAVFVPSITTEVSDNPNLLRVETHQEMTKSPSKQIKAKSTTDLTQTGVAKTNPVSGIVKEAKIHKRRRCNSEGKSDSESVSVPQSVNASRPRRSSRSPRRSKRSQSSGNLLTLPFENYLELQTAGEQSIISQARQRYRDGRARGMRTPSPQLVHRPEIITHPTRPVSTPPVISHQLNHCARESPVKQSPGKASSHNKKGESIHHTQQTVSSKALQSLLEGLDPSHDMPTHQWLTERVAGHVHSARDDISLEDWFQNAPDSVKQKLVSLLPKLPREGDTKVSRRKTTAKSVDVQISTVHLCNSADDTLRSTSPLPDEERSIVSNHSLTEYLPDSDEEEDYFTENPALIIVDKSPRDRWASEDAVHKQTCDESKPTLPLPTDHDPMSSPLISAQGTSASERKRSLSMQSYTLEEPSEALINSTLNETSTNHSQATPKSIQDNCAIGTKSSERKSRADNPRKVKSKIPTPKSGTSLLSKCQLDTPSPAAQTSNKQSSVDSSSTPVASGSGLRHRHLIKLMNNSDITAGLRAITPTPPGRAKTPTPPDRPRSETGWSRSRSRSRVKGEQDKSDGSLPSMDQSKKKQHEHSKCFIPRSKSLKHTPNKQADPPGTAEGNKKVKRSVSFDRSVTPKYDEEDKQTLCTEESPLKNDENRSERLSRARQQLALLKSKFADKVKSIQEGLRPASAIESSPQRSGTPVNDLRPHTQPAKTRRKTSLEVDESNTKQQAVSLDGKENMNRETMSGTSSPVPPRPQSRNKPSSVHDDEIPIDSVYTLTRENHITASDIGLSKVLSVSHKVNQPLSLSKSQSKELIGKPSLILSKRVCVKLGALIKGHLVRKLHKCSRVKSIVKTIQDCQSLLPNLISNRASGTLHDANFQLRLKLQAARNDLYEVFFEMHSYQRMALIKQSEKVQARLKMRQGKTSDRNRSSTPNADKRRSRRDKAITGGGGSPVPTKPSIYRHHRTSNTSLKPMLV